jgi:AraC-like DNA-binding protein
MNPVLPELLVSKVQFARLGGLTLFQTVSANGLDFDVEQSSKFFEFAGDVADADGASIAETSGFSSPFHLSSAFKKTHGLSPDSWRKKIKKSPHG